jgi:hypothetical protein
MVYVPAISQRVCDDEEFLDRLKHSEIIELNYLWKFKANICAEKGFVEIIAFDRSLRITSGAAVRNSETALEILLRKAKQLEDYLFQFNGQMDRKYVGYYMKGTSEEAEYGRIF